MALKGRQQENNKLREEIKQLRNALKDIKDDIPIQAPLRKLPSNSPKSPPNKYLDLNTYHTAPLPAHYELPKFQTENPEDYLKSSLELSLDSSQFKENSLFLGDNILNPSPRMEISSGLIKIFDSPKNYSSPSDKAETISPKKNLETSIENPKKKSFQSSLDSNSLGSDEKIDQKTLLTEIENLRKENTLLRLQLQSKSKPKLKRIAKSPKPRVVSVPFSLNPTQEFSDTLPNRKASRTPKPIRPETIRPMQRRIYSRSKSKSLTPRDLSVKSNDRSPKRYRHCNICDHLLSKGYSTKYCSKHGNTLK